MITQPYEVQGMEAALQSSLCYLFCCLINVDAHFGVYVIDFSLVLFEPRIMVILYYALFYCVVSLVSPMDMFMLPALAVWYLFPSFPNGLINE